jgi:hypothetical protein
MTTGLMTIVAVAAFAVPAGATPRASGNGEASKTATTILADAKAATAATASVRVAGTVYSSGKKTALDIVSAKGSGGGTIAQNGTKINVIVVPPDVYMKADAASWTKLAGTAAAGQLFADKWLQTTTTDANFGSFAKLLDTGTLTQDITANGAMTKGSVTTFRGKPAVPLKDDNGTLYVAATGAPRILGIVGTGPKKGSVVLFTQYGTAQVPGAPSGAVSLSQLEQTSAGSS